MVCPMFFDKIIAKELGAKVNSRIFDNVNGRIFGFWWRDQPPETRNSALNPKSNKTMPQSMTNSFGEIFTPDLNFVYCQINATDNFVFLDTPGTPRS